MVIETAETLLTVGGSPMRTVITAPRAAGRYPGMLLYSDIFQLTPSTLRCAARLAGYGFVVAAPEIYHRLEAPGTAWAFDDEGRTRGLAAAKQTAVGEIDADCRAVLDYLATHPKVAGAGLGALGFCIGGHLAFRAALQPDVKATVCFYATGVQNGELGKDADAGSLGRAGSIAGSLLMIFGTLDPHVPAEARRLIERELKTAGVHAVISEYTADHAFMRDEGPRYDPALTDRAWAQAIAFLRRAFGAAATS